jgi:hypothetical protein
MADKKVLLMAGTHQREVGFSHPVADIILDRLNLNVSKSDETFVGIDGATKADVWDTENLTVAKLYEYGNGRPTIEWLEEQTLDTLVFLTYLKKRCASQIRPPRTAESFGGESQWTSVHEPILYRYRPIFFIDFHSYHINTENQTGIGMQINSHADKELDPILINALKVAKSVDAQIYGDTQVPIRDYSQIRNLLLPDYFKKKELMEVLTDSSSLDENLQKRFKQLEEEKEKIRQNDFDISNENGWFFTSFGRPEPRGNYYLFEAKHWQRNQQEATARFILEYLIPEVKTFGKYKK